jgi:hypothetical protein
MLFNPLTYFDGYGCPSFWMSLATVSFKITLNYIRNNLFKLSDNRCCVHVSYGDFELLMFLFFKINLT